MTVITCRLWLMRPRADGTVAFAYRVRRGPRVIQTGVVPRDVAAWPRDRLAAERWVAEEQAQRNGRPGAALEAGTPWRRAVGDEVRPETVFRLLAAPVSGPLLRACAEKPQTLPEAAKRAGKRADRAAWYVMRLRQRGLLEAAGPARGPNKRHRLIRPALGLALDVLLDLVRGGIDGPRAVCRDRALYDLLGSRQRLRLVAGLARTGAALPHGDLLTAAGLPRHLSDGAAYNLRRLRRAGLVLATGRPRVLRYRLAGRSALAAAVEDIGALADTARRARDLGLEGTPAECVTLPWQVPCSASSAIGRRSERP